MFISAPMDPLTTAKLSDDWKLKLRRIESRGFVDRGIDALGGLGGGPGGGDWSKAEASVGLYLTVGGGWTFRQTFTRRRFIGR